MRLDDFIRKWTNKECDFDGVFGSQCVDLYRFYLKEVLNLPQTPPVVGAADIWDTAGNNFIKITNTPDAIPKKGDIIIWSKNTGRGFGHVAIYVDGDVNTFNSFDCNWPDGTLPHIQGHYYKNVIGWLRPKGENMSDIYKGIDLDNKESIKVCVDSWKDIVDGKYIKKEEYQKLADDLKNEISANKARIEDEKLRYKEFIGRLADKLQSSQSEPEILEQITRLIQFEDLSIKQEKAIEGLKADIEKMKKEGKVEVVQSGQSRLCAWMARHGL